MSSFIEKDDYANCIKDNLLDDLTEIDDDKINKCEEEAIEYMASFLSSRYDVEAIFDSTGDERHSLVLKYAKDITIFYLHSLTDASKVPSFRAKNFEHAKEWLQNVSEMKVNPRNLPALESPDNDYIQHGSNPKRTNHI